MGSIPGWGAKIPCAFQTKNQNIKQKQYCNKFNKDFKTGPHKKKKNLKKSISGRRNGMSESTVMKQHILGGTGPGGGGWEGDGTRYGDGGPGDHA